MKFNARALVWFLGSLAAFWLLLRFPSRADQIVRALIWAYVAVVSIVMVILAIRRGRLVSSDAALPDRLRRWIHGDDVSR
jgi:hypothetical protein